MTFPEWDLFQKFKRFIEASRTSEFFGPGEGQGGRGTETTNLAAHGPQGWASPPLTSWVTQSKSMSISEPQLVPGRTTGTGTNEGGPGIQGCPLQGPLPLANPLDPPRGSSALHHISGHPGHRVGVGVRAWYLRKELIESSLGESTLAWGPRLLGCV